MDDDVVGLVDVQAVVAEVAADRLYRAAVEAVERRAREDLVGQAVVRVAAQQDGDRRVRQLAHDLGEHCLADEPRRAGQQQRLSGQPLSNVS